MILVTVGTHNHPFDRLVRGADELAAGMNEEVIIQRGCSAIEPGCAQHFSFASSQQMQDLCRAARVIITHAAVGSIILAMQEGKPVILVPRLSRYGEVIDDHQRQIAEALSAQGQVVMVIDPNGPALQKAVEQVKVPDRANGGAELLVRALHQRLDRWASSGDR